MALAIDASSPAIAVQSTGSVATVATASFTPPAGATLLIRYSANTIDPNDPGNPTITDSLGVPLTYTSVDIGKRPDTPAADGQVATWTAQVATSAPMTVTVTNGAASPNRHAAVAVTVLTGADTSTPVGQHGKNSSATSIASIAQGYTATRTGSQGFLVVSDWFDAGAETVGGSGNTLEGSADVASNYTYAFLRRTSADGVASSTTTITATLPGNSTNIRWAWVEILPALATGGSTYVPAMPPWLLLALLMRRAAAINSLIAQLISAESGAAVAAAQTTGAAVKVAVQTGSTAAAGRTAGAEINSRVQTGTAVAAPRTTGAEINSRVQTGAATTAARTTGAEINSRAQRGACAAAGRTTGVQVNSRVQVGATRAAPLVTGAATKVAVELGAARGAATTSGFESTGAARAQTGACSAAGRATGTAAKVVPAAGAARAAARNSALELRVALTFGTAVTAARSTGFEAPGDARSQTGRAGAAGRGAGFGAKLTPQTGGSTAAARAAAVEVKHQAQASRAYATGAGAGLALKRTAQTGRAFGVALAFGSQAFVPARTPLGDRLEEILNTLISFVMRLGAFDSVMGHEPKSPPRNGLTAALWLQAMQPAIGQSSLDSTALRVAWYLRIYQNFLSVPEDAIDPKVMRAMALVMEALSADFDLDLPGVRAIDLLGMTGVPMGAEAGYVPMGQPPKIYRCMTLTIPIIVDDAFVQTA